MALSLKTHGFNIIVEALLDRNQATDTSSNDSGSQRHTEEAEIVVSWGRIKKALDEEERCSDVALYLRGGQT